MMPPHDIRGTSQPQLRIFSWEALTLLAVVAAPLLLILLPARPTLLLGVLAVLLLLGYTLLQIGRYARACGILRGGVHALLFLLFTSLLLSWLRSEWLFGYKAVDDRLQPALIRGDHYFGDKFFFRHLGVQVGDVVLFRPPQGKLTAGRVVRLADANAVSFDQGIYGLQTDGQSAHIENIPASFLIARAVIIYGSYNPETNQLLWQRSGRRVR